MYKKVFGIVLCFFLALSLLVGCETEGYTVRNCKTSENSDGFSAEYSLFNGKREYKVTVKEGETLSLSVTWETEEGALSLTVGQKGKEPIYTGSTGEDIPSSFTVNLKESGTYILCFTAKAHKGGYRVSYTRAR